MPESFIFRCLLSNIFSKQGIKFEWRKFRLFEEKYTSKASMTFLVDSRNKKVNNNSGTQNVLFSWTTKTWMSNMHEAHQTGKDPEDTGSSPPPPRLRTLGLQSIHRYLYTSIYINPTDVGLLTINNWCSEITLHKALLINPGLAPD